MRDAAANLSAEVKDKVTGEIKFLFKEGWNTLTCWTYDARPFVLYVTLAHRRTMEDVRALIPPDPRPKDTALQVRLCSRPASLSQPVPRHSVVVPLRGQEQPRGAKTVSIQARNQHPPLRNCGARQRHDTQTLLISSAAVSPYCVERRRSCVTSSTAAGGRGSDDDVGQPRRTKVCCVPLCRLGSALGMGSNTRGIDR